MKGDVQRVKRAAESVGQKIGERGGEKVSEMVRAGATQGGLPKDLLGINDGMIETIYGQAYRLYNTGKYKDASQMFRLLIMLNPTESKYSMGLAACFHMLKEYASAIELYTICGTLDPENPVPHFHASDCYLQMDNPISALVSLEMAVKRAGEKPQFSTLRDRALLTISSVKEKIKNPVPVSSATGSFGT